MLVSLGCVLFTFLTLYMSVPLSWRVVSIYSPSLFISVTIWVVFTFNVSRIKFFTWPFTLFLRIFSSLSLFSSDASFTIIAKPFNEFSSKGLINFSRECIKFCFFPLSHEELRLVISSMVPFFNFSYALFVGANSLCFTFISTNFALGSVSKSFQLTSICSILESFKAFLVVSVSLLPKRSHENLPIPLAPA